jgi:phosphate acyltransferase
MLSNVTDVVVAVDAMGGDNAPAAIVAGAVAAARNGMQIALVGRGDAIDQQLERLKAPGRGIELIEAPDVIAMDEHATAALRHKRGSSIAVGIDLVRRGAAGAFISAGNTGAVMAVATLTLGRQPGIDRPALGTIFPGRRGPFLILDVGANADAKPVYLDQFARLGVAYAREVLGIAQPRVGLLNIGEEAGKGNELAREAYTRLSALEGIRFAGNVEGKDLPRNAADVVVTDGFSGNIAIKTAEGAAEFILSELRGALTAKLRYKLAALVLRPALLSLRERIDYANYGGAPLLGLNGVVRILHGRSDERAVTIAIEVAARAAGGVAAVAGLNDQRRGSSRAAGNGDES